MPMPPALRDQQPSSEPYVRPWRSNKATVAPWNPLATWIVYRIPLRQLLDGNGWPCSRTISQRQSNFRDRTIKMLPWVPLTDHDIDNIAELCTSAPDRNARTSTLDALEGRATGIAPSPPPYNVQVNFHTVGASYLSMHA